MRSLDADALGRGESWSIRFLLTCAHFRHNSHIGSTRNPLFNQVDDVHIYLFNGQTGDQVYYWEENKLQGSIQVSTNDSFWGAAALNIQPGHNQSFPYYFVIIPSTATVHNGETSEPTFTGIRE